MHITNVNYSQDGQALKKVIYISTDIISKWSKVSSNQRAPESPHVGAAEVLLFEHQLHQIQCHRLQQQIKRAIYRLQNKMYVGTYLHSTE